MKPFFTLLLFAFFCSAQKTNATIRTFQFSGITRAPGSVIGVPLIATIVYDDAASPIDGDDGFAMYNLISFVVSVDGNTYTASSATVTIELRADLDDDPGNVFRVVGDAGLLQLAFFQEGPPSINNLNLPTSINLATFNSSKYAAIINGSSAQYYALITSFCLPNPVVTTNADAGAGSLRQAVIDACPGSTITFDPLLNGQTITLASPLPTIDKDLTIEGPGADKLIISGNNAVQIFLINSSSNFTISGLTITKGTDVNRLTVHGGAISVSNHASLTVNDCVFTNNESEIEGGAIRCFGAQLTVNRSSFSGNTIGQGSSVGGGAISVNNPFNITNSTFIGNSAKTEGGALLIGMDGSITNCTITGNAVTGNGPGGGVYGYCCNNFTITNSIIAGNTSAGSGPDIVGSFNSTNNNIIGIGGAIGFADGVNGNKVGTAANPLNPLLSAIGNYGGTTPTIALLPGSPALNAGTNTGAPSTDQRGISRPQQSAADIGAFESQGFSLTATGGNNQSVKAGSTFAESLMVSLTANDPNEPVDGAIVTFIAPAPGASATLSGNPATISGGTGSVVATANGNVGGPYTVSASVAGISTGANFSLTNLPNAISTTTVLTSSPNPSCSGSAVTFTATVTGGGNAVTTGTVSFDDGINTLASNVPVNTSGQASFSVSNLAVNTYNIRAVYNGTGDFVTSNGSVTHTVIKCCVITCPSNITVNNKTLLCGAYVSYPAATTNGSCGTLTYSIKSGSWFPVGTTTVKVTSPTGQTCSFTVTVKNTQKPVIVCPANISVTASSNACSKAVNFSVTALDNCSGIIVTSVPASGGTFNVGTTTVTATATDASGNKTTSTFTVTVKESTPPVITCPASITVNAPTGQCSATVNPGTATATDNCSAATVTGTRSDNKALNASYPSGVTIITWKAKDASGNTSTCQQKITVKDLQPPVVTNASVSPSVLWPANHSLQTVTVNYTNTDNCPSCSCQLTVTSNEPVSGTGSGDLSPDWQYVDAHKIKFRAERKQTGTGRIYTITITCTDPSGNSTIKTVTVKVPINAPTANRGETETPVVQEIATMLRARVIPNPAERTFNLVVEGGNNEAMEIKVFDITGRVVQQLKSAATNVVRFGDNLVQGTYIIEVRQGESRVVLKAIKQQ